MCKIKKLIGVIAAGIMVCSMGMAAFAADSPTATGAVSAGQYTDADGCTVKIKVSALAAEDQPKADLLNDKALLKSLIGEQFTDNMEVISVQDVSIEEIINSTGQQVDVNAHHDDLFPATVTFSVPGVVPTTKAAVLHYPKEGSAWEVVPSSVGEGTITATFQSFSPVAFVIDKTTMAANTTGTGAAAKVSPKTGEFPTVGVLTVIALLAACGAAGLAGKKRA